MNEKRTTPRAGATRLLAVLLLAGVLPVLGAQALKDNPDYRQARELQRLSEQALEAGEYDQAATYARESKLYAAKAEAYAARLVLAYKANGWRQYARDKVADARAQGAERTFAEGFARASEEYRMAEGTYDAEEYEASISHSRQAVAELADFHPVTTVAAAEPPAAEPTDADTAASEDWEEPAVEPPVYPQYYRVRLVPADRDTLNKIAGYPFVYNDRYQWRVLYEANKSKLRRPNNPHLIHPDTLLLIPSLNGEKREGIYDPQKEYPTFEKK